MTLRTGDQRARDAGRIRGPLALAAALFALAALPATALAGTADIIAPQNDPHTIDDGWQAGVCTTDTPTCSVNTPGNFFERAAAHPQVGFTQFIVKEESGPIFGERPVGNLKTVRVDLPVGLSVNPQATPQCPLEAGDSPGGCPINTKVGTSAVTVTNPSTGLSLELPAVNVYNLVPLNEEPARFGLSILGNDIFLEAGIAWEGDYHEYFTIAVAKLEVGVPLEVARIAKNRLVFDGRSGDGTFITTPSTCHDPEAAPYEHIYSTWLRADSYEIPDPSFPAGSEFFESPLPEETGPKECDSIPYDPSLAFDPNVAATDSPAGAATSVDVPHLTGGGERESSHTLRAAVTLPAGMGLNPSVANGLEACTDAQFGKGARDPVACPPASKIGTVAIETPPLPPGSIEGNVYVGRQLSRDPASGQEYRIFVDGESPRYGISARLIGNVRADPQTGRLTAVFDDPPLGGLPQVPFSSFQLKFDDGSRAPLTSPPTCGPHTASAAMTPWSGNPAATPSDEFSLGQAPDGGECAETLAQRPFAPDFAARSGNHGAGAFSDLQLELSGSDGEQELKGVDVVLPRGLTAKLAGLQYCSQAALSAAAANAGTTEAANPSCPPTSLVGAASVLAGSGPAPLPIGGKVFLAGPYAGAPLSLAIVTPATAGPFDLGSVVARVALFLDRETAQVHAVSDPIPHVFGGALLDIRSIVVSLDRPGFSLNPTNCTRGVVAGTVRGGGANPVDPAAFSSFPVSAPFQVSGCEGLGFEPQLFLRLFGARKRARNPKLRAVLVTRKGDANIGRAVVTLPQGLILDQSSIARVCTRVQFSAAQCPSSSVYGYVRAFTPLLDDPLEGPVYLRSSDNLLPDLVASLHGQVDIDLVGRIDSVKGRIRNSFETVPDVPVSKFVLTVRGGRTGLLSNSRNLCGKRARRMRAVARFTGQNGKPANLRPKVRKPCRRGHGKQARQDRHRRRQ